MGHMFLPRKIPVLVGAQKVGSDSGVSVLEEVSSLAPFFRLLDLLA